MARVELSAEARAIETLIEAGQKDVANARLRAASAYFGRRPEYRYLLCLFDSRFRVRADAELLREVTELVGDQPELVEATALLAELHARAGDAARAGLFARMALDSTNPTARARATGVLAARAEASLTPAPQSDVESIPASASAEEGPPPSDTFAVSAWFERARRELVHPRAPSYGVRAFESVVEMLLDWARTVAEGHSFLSKEPLALTRASLIVVDEVVLAQRRQLGRRAAAPASESSPLMAVAGFFMAVVLHELDASVVEISPDDGGCKVLLPSGAGVRPVLVATAYADGSGPSLVATFDRLAAARELASGPPSSHAARRVSSARMAAAAARSSGPKPAMGLARAELALSRPEVEAAPLRVLDRPTWPADLPPFDLAAIAAALAASALGQEIAARSGAFLAPTPASIEALESYCRATRGDRGAAPGATGWNPTDEEEELILAWGALLGETLIAAYGGVWECDPNAPSDPRLFRVICQDKAASWPVTQVYLRLKEGPRYDLIEFVAAVGRSLS